MTAIIQRHETTAGTPQSALEDAVLRTVAYADVFDFAPTVNEVHRYLIGTAATVADVARLLASASPLDGRLTVRDGLIALMGREELFAKRARRRAATRRLYPRAVRYARAVGTLPGVRMVAITGGLAAGNDEAGSDIDLFLVTTPGRLWVTRAEVVAMVRLVAAASGDELCPNYLVATSQLALSGPDLYRAQEVAHMRPVVGIDVYRELRAANPWVTQFLPNAAGAPEPSRDQRPVSPRAHAVGDAVLRTPPWRLGEMLERRRRLTALTRRASEATDAGLEASFGPDHCKGHFEPYGSRIRAHYEAACDRVGVTPDWHVTT